MDIKSVIAQLCACEGISGCENKASKKACELLNTYASASVDDFGNVIGRVGEFDDSKQTILLDAHIDEIGMIVTYITDEGFLKVSNCGGVDTRLLLAQEVTVLGKEPLFGVITSTPPHLEKDSSKAVDFDSLSIDIGLTKEQACQLVNLGDGVIIANELADIKNNQVTSKALDDRCGVVAILYALELLQGKSTKYNIAVVFSAQEETGERGIKTAAYKVNADMAIAVDVSFAKVAGEGEVDCGKLSKGVMIGFAPTLRRGMSTKMVEVAKANDIPYQYEIMDGKTGTNADAIGVSKSGVQTVTLSIPLKYMHTPIETINVADVESTARLIAKFCESEGE